MVTTVKDIKLSCIFQWTFMTSLKGKIRDLQRPIWDKTDDSESETNVNDIKLLLSSTNKFINKLEALNRLVSSKVRNVKIIGIRRVWQLTPNLPLLPIKFVSKLKQHKTYYLYILFTCLYVVFSELLQNIYDMISFMSDNKRLNLELHLL